MSHEYQSLEWNPSWKGKPSFPTFQFFILSICRIGEPIILTSIPLYLPRMLRSLDILEQHIPYWTSICISVYSVSLCLSAPIWGWLADNWGRRPTILLAISIQIVSMVLFGLSKTLSFLIVMAGLLGISSANSGTLRTTAAELVPWKELQPKAFGVLPMMWNIGSIIGPLVGGLLANPVSLYPEIFARNKFLITFPWVMPNLVVGSFLIIGWIIGLLFLTETLEISSYHDDYGLRFGQQVASLFRSRSRTSGTKYRMLSEESQRSSDVDELESPDSKDERRGSVDSTSDDTETKTHRILTTQSCLNLLVHALLVTHSMIYDEFLPIFMYTQKGLISDHLHKLIARILTIQGGLGLTSGQISFFFTISAIYSVIIQLTLFPFVARHLGTLPSLRLSSNLFPFIYIIVPFLALYQQSSYMSTITTLALLLCKATCATVSFPCSMILLNKSASSPRVLGTLNGLATSTSALCRAVGALVFGAIFTMGLERGNVILPWWVLAGISVVGALPVFWLADLVEEGERK